MVIDNNNPVGSGCVAQVYRGYIVKDSKDCPTFLKLSSHDQEKTEVAIKVLHPGIKNAILADIQLMHHTTAVIEILGGMILNLSKWWNSAIRHIKDNESVVANRNAPPLVCISLLESVNEFAKFMNAQTDMRVEAHMLNRFRLLAFSLLLR